MLNLVDMLVDEPLIDESEIQDGDELSIYVLEHFVHKLVMEVVYIGVIDEVWTGCLFFYSAVYGH